MIQSRKSEVPKHVSYTAFQRCFGTPCTYLKWSLSQLARCNPQWHTSASLMFIVVSYTYHHSLH